MLKYTLLLTNGELIVADEVLNFKDRVEYFKNGKWDKVPWHYTCLTEEGIVAVRELRGIRVED